MRYFAIAGLFILALTCDAYAEKMYISDIVKVTLRTGPSLEHRVIQMLESGDEIKVLEPGKDWTLVRSTSGKEGWILSRYLSPDIPSDLVLGGVQEKYDKLLVRAASMEEANMKFIEENKKQAEELTRISASLKEISNQYELLKTASADFLELRSRYEKVTQELEKQTRRATELNKLLQRRNIQIGLLGAGVLFFGFLIGYNTKKKRRRSSLL
ncbi:MAG: TIGR04211 family SH3 domain-containing protein [Deltaproteobacteria bacterium]|nr:MAG: TIGR04211 family SH3 domain-containing protein [Deltaproteobacteria bacterium]